MFLTARFTFDFKEALKLPIVILWKKVMQVAYRGDIFFCPVCEQSSRKFLQYGAENRTNAQCPHCRSLERHRLLWLYLEKRTNFFDNKPKKMLHVAPERCLENRFRRYLGDNYITADLQSPRAMVKMDITDIQYKNETFDIIYCSHVLEHVLDDRKAMQEFHRVLKSNGWAILLVPITAKKTFEDSSITEPAERLKAFGQTDHVRKYGPDYADRLREAGFIVRTSDFGEFDEHEQVELMGLSAASGTIYYCTKREKTAAEN